MVLFRPFEGSVVTWTPDVGLQDRVRMLAVLTFDYSVRWQLLDETSLLVRVEVEVEGIDGG